MLSLARKFRPLSEDELSALPPQSWLIDQHLPEAGLGVIYGKPKSGKTFVAVSMACAVAAGVPWLGEAVPAGREVVYIYAEGWRSTHKRVQAWKVANGVPALPRLFAIPCPVALTDPHELTAMCEAIGDRGLAPGLIVVDTLARCFGGLDENSTQDMGKFVESCDSLRLDAFPGCTVMIVHHSGKAAAQGARGSNALLGAVDVEWEVCRGQGYNHLILRNTAQKEREEFEPRDLEKFDVPLPDGSSSATVRWQDTAPVADACDALEGSLEGSQLGSLEYRAEMFAALREAGSRGLSFGEWRQACGNPNRDTFKSRVRGLRDKGRVALRDSCYFLP